MILKYHTLLPTWRNSLLDPPKKRHQGWFVIKGESTKKEAPSVVRHQSLNYERKNDKCGLWSKSQLQKRKRKEDDTSCAVLHQATILKEAETRRNCRRRCTKYGSSLKLQLQKKDHQIWFVIKVEATKEEISSVVHRQSRNWKIKKKDVSCLVHHQSHNSKRIWSTYDSSSNPQL